MSTVSQHGHAKSHAKTYTVKLGYWSYWPCSSKGLGHLLSLLVLVVHFILMGIGSHVWSHGGLFSTPSLAVCSYFGTLSLLVTTGNGFHQENPMTVLPFQSQANAMCFEQSPDILTLAEVPLVHQLTYAYISILAVSWLTKIYASEGSGSPALGIMSGTG